MILLQWKRWGGLGKISLNGTPNCLAHPSCGNHLFSFYWEKITDGLLYFVFSLWNQKRKTCTIFRLSFFVLFCVCVYVCVCVCENEKWKTKFEIQNRYPLDIRKLTIFWIFIRISWVKNESKYSVSNLFFNLSRKQNGTLDTRILLAPRYG